MISLKDLRRRNALQLYARAKAPCRDYHGLTISLTTWRVGRTLRVLPKQALCSLKDWKSDKNLRDQVEGLFGAGTSEYVTALASGELKFETLPFGVFLSIVRFLNFKDVLTLSRCSIILREVCNKDEVWRLMFVKKMGRPPSNEEKWLALGYTWREVLKKRLEYVQKVAALQNTCAVRDITSSRAGAVLKPLMIERS
ncbi:uncharacterized protein LOC132697755 isoform X2 [Cylas formicarius]|uniref:uncharacterized protein LOC132697755 isoform X2 n=1 Tax=Cylas formicarius TaxID=197179 RepID=UPI002958CD75|nr:uncharacterized protein LOC132697755 isoform X2 [Cylas formicarius]